jgi:hypothetical protein
MAGTVSSNFFKDLMPNNMLSSTSLATSSGFGGLLIVLKKSQYGGYDIYDVLVWQCC